MSDQSIFEEKKIRSSNIQDNLGNQLSKSEKEDLTDGGNCSCHKHDDRYLYKENTSSFTPDGDYEPATKKYVDDNVNSISFNVFGTGSDGDVTISSNTTLTRDMFYNNLTVNSGVTLNTGGYRIFVKGTLTNNGTISRKGVDGADGGTALSSGTLGGSGAGGTGGSSNGGNTSYSLGGSGGDGGDSSSCAGNGGTASSPSNFPYFLPYILMMMYNEGTTWYQIQGGAGGGWGSHDDGTQCVGSCNGGSGGGVIMIAAKEIVNNGTITAKGGDGESSYGGGGGGGVIALVYKSLTNSGTITAAHGFAGGGSAEPGQDGTIIYYQI